MSVLSEIGNLHTISGSTITQTFGDLAVSIPDIAWICCTLIVLALIIRPIVLAAIREYKQSNTCFKKFADLERRLGTLEKEKHDGL